MAVKFMVYESLRALTAAHRQMTTGADTVSGVAWSRGAGARGGRTGAAHVRPHDVHAPLHRWRCGLSPAQPSTVEDLLMGGVAGAAAAAATTPLDVVKTRMMCSASIRPTIVQVGLSAHLPVPVEPSQPKGLPVADAQLRQEEDAGRVRCSELLLLSVAVAAPPLPRAGHAQRLARGARVAVLLQGCGPARALQRHQQRRLLLHL